VLDVQNSRNRKWHKGVLHRKARSQSPERSLSRSLRGHYERWTDSANRKLILSNNSGVVFPRDSSSESIGMKRSERGIDFVNDSVSLSVHHQDPHA